MTEERPELRDLPQEEKPLTPLRHYLDLLLGVALILGLLVIITWVAYSTQKD
jgi:hypothetical protein